jgi:hypothetical protein
MSVVVIDDEVLQFQTGSHDKIIASEKACCNSKHMCETHDIGHHLFLCNSDERL